MSSKEHNYGGRSLVVDRVTEIYGKRSSTTTQRIKISLDNQTSAKDLEALREELSKVTSDGVISSSEKPGLKREWASLESSWLTINANFSGDDELSKLPSYLTLRSTINQLSDILDEVFSDMSSDYVDAEKIAELTSLFSEAWNEVTICNQSYDSTLDFVSKYTLTIDGDHTLDNDTSITLTARIYRNGVEQQLPEFVDGNNYTWTREKSGMEPKKGRTATFSFSDFSGNPTKFICTYSFTPEGATIPNALATIFELSYGTIVEYVWSNYLSETEVATIPDSSWTKSVPSQPTDVKYLWRRESVDLGETWTYFRETGEQGEKGDKGDQGEQGEQGEPGKDGADGVSVVSITAEYAIGDYPTISPSTTDPSLWSTTRPERPENKYLWMREKITYSNGKETYTSPRNVTGDKGDTGPSVKYYYKYTKTNEPDAYKSGAAVFRYGNRIMVVGRTIMVAGTGCWSEHVPQGEQYSDDFLWTKIVYPDGTYDIVPPAKQGAPAEDIILVASDTTYQMTTRNVVKEDKTFTFSIERRSVLMPVVWSVSPSSSDLVTSVDASNPDLYSVKIKKGSTLQNFTVTVATEDGSLVRDVVVKGVDGGVSTPYYFSIWPKNADDPLPTYYRSSNTIDWGEAELPGETPDGHLLTGDYILYKSNVKDNLNSTEIRSTEYIPCRYNQDDDEWYPVTTNDSNYSEMMGTMIADVVKTPDMPVTTGALYGFFQNLAVNKAFILNLLVQVLELQNGGVIKSKGYNINDIYNVLKQGFYMDSYGYSEFQRILVRGLEVNGLDAQNANISGNFHSEAFETVEGSPAISSADIKTEYQSFWNNADCLKPQEVSDMFVPSELSDEIVDIAKIYYTNTFYFSALSKSGVVYIGVIDAENGIFEWNKSFDLKEALGSNFNSANFCSFNIEHDSSTLDPIFQVSGLLRTSLKGYCYKIAYNLTSGNLGNSSTFEIDSDFIPVRGSNTFVTYGDWKFYTVTTNSSNNVIARYDGDCTGIPNGWLPAIEDIRIEKCHTCTIIYENDVPKFVTMLSKTFSSVTDQAYSVLNVTGAKRPFVVRENNQLYTLLFGDNGTIIKATNTETAFNLSASYHIDGISQGGHIIRVLDYYVLVGEKIVVTDLDFTKLGEDAISPSSVFRLECFGDAEFIAVDEFPLVLMGSQELGKGALVFTIFDYRKICTFFTSVRSKIADETAIPDVEPLWNVSQVSGTLEIEGNTKQLSRMRVTYSVLTLFDSQGIEYTFDRTHYPNSNFFIKNLTILEKNPSLLFGNAEPINEQSTFGSEENPFIGYFSDIYAERIWGAVFN